MVRKNIWSGMVTNAFNLSKTKAEDSRLLLLSMQLGHHGTFQRSCDNIVKYCVKRNMEIQVVLSDSLSLK